MHNIPQDHHHFHSVSAHAVAYYKKKNFQNNKWMFWKGDFQRDWKDIYYLPNDMFTSSSNSAFIIECGWGIKVEANIVWPSGFFWYNKAPQENK